MTCFFPKQLFWQPSVPERWVTGLLGWQVPLLHIPQCCGDTPGLLVTCGQQRPLLAHRNLQLWVQHCIVSLLLLSAGAGSSEHQGDADPTGELQGGHEPGGLAGPLAIPTGAVQGELAAHLLPVTVHVQQGLCVWDGHRLGCEERGRDLAIQARKEGNVNG